VREHPLARTVTKSLAEFLITDQSGELLLELLRVVVEKSGLAGFDFLIGTDIRSERRLRPRPEGAFVPFDRRLRSVEGTVHEGAQVDVSVEAGPLDLVGG